MPHHDAAEAEVGDLGGEAPGVGGVGAAEQDVAGGQVAVQDVHAVQVCHAARDLPRRVVDRHQVRLCSTK